MEPTLLLLGILAIAIVCAWAGAGSLRSLDGAAGWAGGRDWPRGVQEADTPHFAVDHWTGRDGALEVEGLSSDDPAPSFELVELGSAPVHRVRVTERPPH